MLSRIGIENKLQLTIALCVVTILVVTTLGNSGGAPWVFFTYRSLLIVVAILSAVGCRQADERIHPMYLIELHLSNVHAREPFRHHSWLSPVAKGIVIGFGAHGYALAIAGLKLLADKSQKA